MSRIGKQVIAIPKGVTVNNAGGRVSVKGPKGELHLQLRSDVTVQVDGSTIKVAAQDQERQTRAYQGTTRALIANMVHGVTKGYEKKLEISGVGYQVVQNGKRLDLSIGFNRPAKFEIPSTVKIDCPTATSIVITGCDKQQVGLVAAAIRKLRKPEPYKGKGIKYSDEIVRRKAGKAFASGGAG
jgi:large subunit ribosomal protein L6